MLGEESPRTIRVFIVADVALYRTGLAEIVARRDGMEVVGTASAASESLVEAMRTQPDVLLLDVAVSDGPQAVAVAAAALPSVKVVALAVEADERAVIPCVEAGACGFVTRDASTEDLVSVIEGAARGEAICSPRIVASLLRRITALAAETRPATDWLRLTRRELEVVELISDGRSNKEIAGRLQIELPTVKNHVHNIFEKLDVHRRAEVGARVRRTAPAQQPLARY